MAAVSLEQGASKPLLEFDLPVDSEYKAMRIKIHSAAQPHMRGEHR